MDKAKIIRDIENYYPIDSEYPDTAMIGRQLLIRAIEQSGFNWRDLPEEVLVKYRDMGFDEENNGEMTAELRGLGLIE